MMNRVLVQASGARVVKEDASVRHLEDGREVLMAGGGLRVQPAFPVVCFGSRYGAILPFVGDYAGGNRSLARVCFYRLKTTIVLLGHKPKPRGPSSTHHLP